jgi:hypothetical protein
MVLQHHGRRLPAQAAATFFALQKFKVKRLDLFFVRLTNWFVGNV